MCYSSILNVLPSHSGSKIIKSRVHKTVILPSSIYMYVCGRLGCHSLDISHCNTPVSYLEGPGFKSRPRDWVSCHFYGFSQSLQLSARIVPQN
jgi:hypothetical protein